MEKHWHKEFTLNINVRLLLFITAIILMLIALIKVYNLVF